MINPEIQYQFVTSQIADRLNRATDALKMFIQIFSAIVGGSIWLTMGYKLPEGEKLTYIRLSDTLAIIVTFVCVVIIAEAFRGWYGYRKAQAELGGRDANGAYRIPPPKLIPPVLAQAAMVIGMIVACGLFYWFNPFALTSN